MDENKALIPLVSLAAIALLASGAFFTMGGMVNTNTSVPPGLYLRHDRPLGIGKIVTFCPPNRPEFQEARTRGYIQGGSCPDNYAMMMLKVAAKYKDTVTINADGVTVNDAIYPQSKALSQDAEGRAMPALAINHYELKENELLLMSDSPADPYDSRYFGLINVEQVDSVVKPVLD